MPPSCGSADLQSADPDLVRLGDLGPSALYAQYSDYQSAALDFGYRRYMKMTKRNLSVYGEGTLGIGFIDSLNVELAAPQMNLVFDNTDCSNQTASVHMGNRCRRAVPARRSGRSEP